MYPVGASGKRETGKERVEVNEGVAKAFFSCEQKITDGTGRKVRMLAQCAPAATSNGAHFTVTESCRVCAVHICSTYRHIIRSYMLALLHQHRLIESQKTLCVCVWERMRMRRGYNSRFHKHIFEIQPMQRGKCTLLVV